MAISNWLRTNPLLSKKQIGEYISARQNPDLLKAFISTFNFAGQRIDEGLRSYLTAFRLPGEAPVIQRLLEAFSKIGIKKFRNIIIYLNPLNDF